MVVSGERGSKRPVVAVDVDEVLGQFVHQLCAFHNASYRTSLTPEDFTTYNFHDAWGGTKEQADAKVCLFFKSSYFLDGLPVIEGAAEILAKWCDRLELHIVTSRQNVLEEHTRYWINKHYSGIFHKLHFGNHYSKQGRVWSKPELCDAINAVMIIDDNMMYATQCAEAGIKTCLFGKLFFLCVCFFCVAPARRRTTYVSMILYEYHHTDFFSFFRWRKNTARERGVSTCRLSTDKYLNVCAAGGTVLLLCSPMTSFAVVSDKVG